MGGSGSKLKKYLTRGDEYAALQLCQNQPALRKSLDPNLAYSQNEGLTPFHLAARLGMRGVVRLFLELGGNPNKRTSSDATALHLLCEGPPSGRRSRTVEASVRGDCLRLLLAWEGPALEGLPPERADLAAQDKVGNTALHYAAASGYRQCVEMLVSAGAELGAENEAKETACDAAERSGQTAIAQFLEAKTLFSSGSAEETEAEGEESLLPVVESYSGLKERDLIEAKDQLLVETSDMLQVPLFTAEALLRNHEWSRQALWTAWNRDPVRCCDRCGVQAPESALAVPRPQPQPQSPSKSERTEQEESADEEEAECEICLGVGAVVCSGECGHGFCAGCWKAYATGKIEAGDVGGLSCPGWSCERLVPAELVERVVSPAVARKYLAFDIKAFVESNPRLQWCPAPGCGNAVGVWEEEESGVSPAYVRAFPQLQPPPGSSRAVACPSGHVFCWECGATGGHEPTSCAKWKDWQGKIAEMRPEELSDTGAASEAAANCLWLLTHSKPCPKCRSPIQKNEGCNHMKCSKCKHDFCWVCLGPWKKHSTDTGGYFRCNRYDDTKKVEERTESAISKAKEESKRAAELNRFVHYYTRFKNHLNSLAMEQGLLTSLPDKVSHLAKSAAAAKEDSADLAFVRQGLDELLRSRRVLSSSYSYGYFLKDSGYNKTIFEYLQNELEVSVEALSGLVGRAYLRGSRGQISHTTALVGSRRQRFLQCICRGLVPPETPPGHRKKGGARRHLPAILGLDNDDDDWAHAGLPPLQSLSASIAPRTWWKDVRGRHHNLSAILDWPEEEEEESSSAADPTAPLPPDMVCQTTDCGRAKARNPRTGQLQSFCSLRCRHSAQKEATKRGGCEEDASGVSEYSGGRREYNVDLMMALKMSRLQLLQDLRALAEAGDESSARAGPSGESGEDWRRIQDEMDPDLQLAIERSVSDLSWAKDAIQHSHSSGVQQLIQGIADKPTQPSRDYYDNNHADALLPLQKNADKVLIAKSKDSHL